MKGHFIAFALLFAGVFSASAQSVYVYEPTVLARKTVDMDGFYLWYPQKDKIWKSTPNGFDSDSAKPFGATLVPDGCTRLVYSAMGENGRRQLYQTRLEDGLWSQPEMLFENLCAGSDEVFPVVSDDGTKLWFSSNGLDSKGGYDLFVCSWNENGGCWSDPVNMGCPYSSPADDFLYMDSSDGKYSAFASNRGCKEGSVNVYILEYDNMPVRKAVSDPAKLKELYAMNVKTDEKADTAPQADEPSDMEREYGARLGRIESLTDSLNAFCFRLEQEREFYGENPSEELLRGIVASEKKIPGLIAAIDDAKADLIAFEKELLKQGTVVNADRFIQSKNAVAGTPEKTYVFTKKTLGNAGKISFREPESKFDYTFQILPQGQYAEDQNLPEGYIFQVHYITLPNKATMAQLRGLSPVYEVKQPNGHHIYRVGVFRTYAEADKALARVKGIGFRSASVVAFKDGKSCSVSEAKAHEGVPASWNIIIPSDGNLSPEVSAAIRQNCDKDLAKSFAGDKITYTISGFASQNEAEELAALIRAAGAAETEVVKIEQQ